MRGPAEENVGSTGRQRLVIRTDSDNDNGLGDAPPDDVAPQWSALKVPDGRFQASARDQFV